MSDHPVSKIAGFIPDYPGRKQLEAALLPLLEPVTKKVAGTTIQRLLGYWMMAHVFGGRDGIIKAGIMSQASAYRVEKEFQQVFKISVAELTVEKVFNITPADKGT